MPSKFRGYRVVAKRYESALLIVSPKTDLKRITAPGRVVRLESGQVGLPMPAHSIFGQGYWTEIEEYVIDNALADSLVEDAKPGE